MEKKRKLSEAINKNDQATRKKTALVHNQTGDALGVDILAKIFDLLPSEELFWNVSLVCHFWQLACWEKLFWKNDGCLDLRAVAPFQCCSSIMPKGYHKHTCAELMKHQLQTILFGTHDAFGNSLKEWRNSIKTIRIPFGLEMRDDFLFSLPCTAVVVAEPGAPGAAVRPLVLSNFQKSNRPFVLSEVREVVLSWNLKRLLFETPLFGKPIFTHSVDLTVIDVFKNILRSSFKRLPVVLSCLQLPGVEGHCLQICEDLRKMVKEFTKCGILPCVRTVAEHRFFIQNPKARKFSADASLLLPLDDESQELACQWHCRCQICEFWLALKDLFSDDKKNISLAWESCQGKQVFLDHYYKAAEIHCSHLDPLALKRAAESEWQSLLVREGVKKVPKKTQRLGSLTVAESTEIRKSIFPYYKYQEIAQHRRKFVKRLLRIRPPFVFGPMTKDERIKCRPLFLRESLILLHRWGGGPYGECLKVVYGDDPHEIS